MKNSAIVTVILVIIVGVAGFFGGVKYQQSKQPTFSRQFGNSQGFMGANGGQQNRIRAGGGQVIGEIINQDDKSITVKLQDGSSKIVLFSDTTTINKATAGSKSDLVVGERVAVFGTTNSDGSVTAQNIQLDPIFRSPTGTPSPR